MNTYRIWHRGCCGKVGVEKDFGCNRVHGTIVMNGTTDVVGSATAFNVHVLPGLTTGSWGTRHRIRLGYPGQDAVDIHLTDWRNNNILLVGERQRVMAALAQGMTFITPEAPEPWA